MGKLVVIGIDGMDWETTERFLPEMPSIRGISKAGFAGEMPSIFPPDSIPSWISIFTGLDPSRHGILETIDYFKKDAKEFAVDTGAFMGKTFWDAASRAGKKVIVVNPLMAYPPWEVNGVMASGPVFISGKTAVYPESVSTGPALPPLGGIVDFPEKGELAGFYEKTKAETAAIVEFTAGLMETRQWDLTFVTLLTMDRVCHFFWRYFDADDPTWPGPNGHSGVIPDFHRFIDGCVGRLAKAAGEDATFMIVSDHGHAMRPPLFFNLNQYLMENGLLESRIRGPKFFSPRYHLENAKNFVLETLHRFDLEDVSYRLARILPLARRLKKKDFMTNPSRNIATASGFGGTNPFGGVDISATRCSQEGLDYEQTRDRVIRLLLEARSRDGENIFLWARRREEMFDGPFIGRYPDILFEMRPRYGTNWSVHLPLVTVNPRHRKISGGHRGSSVLIAGPLPGYEVAAENVASINIAASIASFLDLPAGGREDREGVSGRSFLRKTGGGA